MSPATRITLPPVSDKTFVLEFWYEWSQLEASHWRGKVRSDQIYPTGFYRPVANPEAAFDFVRQALAQAAPEAYAASLHLKGDDCTTTDSKSRPLGSVVRLLRSIIWRGS